MLCPFCGQEIKDSANFCGKCGHKIPRCPTCNRVIRARVKFCNHDGTPLPEELLEGLPEVAAAAPVQEEQPQRFCKQCGKPCAPGQTLCPDCQRKQAHVEPEKPKKKKSILPVLLVLLALVLVLGGVGFAFARGYFPLGGGQKTADEESDAPLETEDDNSQSEAEDASTSADETGGLMPITGGSAADESTEEETATESDETADAVAADDTDAEHRYEIVMADVSWTEALELAQEAGGHLATITTVQEYDQICELAAEQEQVWLEANEDSESVTLYLWLGGNITSSSMDWGDEGTWITGETWIADTDEWWYPGEPSKEDEDGTKEYYLCLWNAQNQGWTLNDQRNDIVTAIPAYAGRVGYVVEYGDDYSS